MRYFWSLLKIKQEEVRVFVCAYAMTICVSALFVKTQGWGGEGLMFLY